MVRHGTTKIKLNKNAILNRKQIAADSKKTGYSPHVCMNEEA